MEKKIHLIKNWALTIFDTSIGSKQEHNLIPKIKWYKFEKQKEEAIQICTLFYHRVLLSNHRSIQNLRFQIPLK